MKKYSAVIFALTSVVCSVLLSGTAQAASVTWDNNAATAPNPQDGVGEWTTANSWWTGAANQTWASGNDAIFGANGTGGAVTLASGTAVNSITINGFSSTYTLGSAGSTVTLTNGITMNASAGAVTIVSPITMGAAQSWINNSANLLTVGTGAVGNGGFLLTIGGSGNTAVSSVIGGAGGLTKSGSGTLTLSGANSFGGQLSIENGTVYTTSINNKSVSGVLGAGTIVVLGASGLTGRLAIQVDAGISTTKDFTLAAGGTGEIQFGNIGTFNMTNADRPLTISGNIGGGGNLVKLGFSPVVLSGNNNYSGTTTVSQGPLRLSSANALPGGIGATGGTSALTINGIDSSGGGAIVELANGNFLRNLGTGVDQFQIPGGVSGFGARGAARQVIVNNDASLELVWGIISTFNPSVLQFGYTATTDNAITLQNKMDLNGATRTITVVNNTATLSGDIRTSSGTAGIIKTGGGTLVLSGANTYNGTTTISAGTLTIGNVATFNNTSQIVLSSGARLEVNAANASLAKLVTGGGVIAGSYLRYSQAQTTAGAANGPGTIYGTVEINLTNVNPDYALDFGSLSTFLNLVAATYTSPITLSGNASIDSSTAVFTLSSGGITASTAGTKTLTLTGSNAGANTIGGVIGNGSGTMAVTKSGAGAWTLSGANTYSGATMVSAGTLILSGASGSVSNSAVTVAGATLTVTNANAASNGDRLSDSLAFTMNGATFNFNNDASANDFSESVGTLTLIGGGNTVAIGQAASGRTSTLTFAGLSRTAGVIDFYGAGLTNAVNPRSKVTFTNPPALTDGIIGPWATVNGTNYATIDVNSNLVAYSGGSVTDVPRRNGASQVIPNTPAATIRIIEGSGTLANLTLAASTTTISNLLQSLSGGNSAATITIGSSETLQLYSLNQVATSGALTLGVAGSAGTLMPAVAGGNLLMINNSSNYMTNNCVIANNTSASSVTKDGSGVLRFTGANTYSGGTVLNAGTLWITNNVNLGAAGSGITFEGSAGLSMGNNVSSTAINLGSRPITINNGAVAGLYHNWADTTITVSNSITGTGGINWGRDPAVAYGGGSGSVYANLLSTSNAFTGPITIGMGTENAQGGGSTFTFNSLADSASPITFNFNGGAVAFNYGAGASQDLTLNSRSLVLGANGNNTTFKNLSSYKLTYNAPLLVSGTGARTLTLGTGTATFGGAIADGLGVVVSVSAGGTWSLGGTNTYSGATTVSGTLTFRCKQAVSPSSAITLSESSIRLLDDGSGTVNIGNNVTLSSGQNGAQSNFGIFVGNSSTANGGTNSSSTTTGSTIVMGTLTFGNRASTNWKLNITGANGYRLQFGNVSLTISANNASSMYGAIFNPTTAPITITGTVKQPDGTTSSGNTYAKYLILDGTSASGTNMITGNIHNASDYPANPNALPLDIIKQNTSTWLLSGTNTCTGATTISGGYLIVNGSLASIAMTVSGGYLCGTGTVSGAVTNSSTGGIDIRDGVVGTLTIGSGLAINGAAGANNIYFDLGTAANGIDKISVTGNVTMATSGAAVITLNQLTGTKVNAGTYDLIAATGTMEPASKFTLTTTNAFGNTFSLQLDGTSKKLQLVVADAAAGSDTAWTGASSATWGLAGNWTAGVPGYGSVVTFYNSGAGNFTTTLDGGREIGSLVYSAGATTATTIGPGSGGMLTIQAPSGTGITVNTPSSGSPTHLIAANVGLASNQTWTVNSGASLSVTNSISDFGGGRSLTKAGAGTLTIGGGGYSGAYNTYSGPTIINGGTLVVWWGTSTTTANPLGMSLPVPANLVLAPGATLLFKSRYDSYSTDRGFTMNGTSDGDSFTLRSDWGGGSQWWGVQFTDSTCPAYGTPNQTRTLILAGDHDRTTDAAKLSANLADNGSGAVSLIKSGVGGWKLSGANTFSGGVTVNAGYLVLANASALGTGTLTMTGGSLYNGSGGSLVNSRNNVQSWNGDFSFTGAADFNIGTGAVTLSGTRTVTVTGNTLTIGGVISGAAGYGLTKAGGGTLALTTNNTYDGATTVSGGTLLFSGVNGTITNSAVMMAGGTLTISNTNAANNTNRVNDSFAFTMNGGTLNFTNDASAGNNFSETIGALTVIGGANTVAIGQSAVGQTSTLTFAGLSRTLGTINFSGPGLTNAVDTRGRITFTNPPALTDGIIGTWATVNGTNYATIDVNSNLVAYSGTFTDVTRLSSGTKVIPNNQDAMVRIIEGSGSAANLTLAAATTTISNLLQSISGGYSPVTVTIGASETLRVYSINQVASAGSLTLGAVAGTGKIMPAVAGGNLLFINSSGNAITNNSVIADNTSASSVTKDGTGTLTLASSNSFTAGFTINAGTVYLGHNYSVGTNTLTINGGTVSVVNNFTFPNNPIVINNSCTFFVPTAQNFFFGNGPITLNNNATVTLQLGQSPNLSNAINNNGYTLTLINTQDGGTTISGKISGAGGLGLRNDLTGNGKTLIVNNSSSDYTGLTTLLSGTPANLAIVTPNLSNAGVAGSLGAPTGTNATIHIYNNVIWQPGGTTDRGLNLASNGVGTVQITVNSSSGNATLSGPITGTGTGSKTLYVNLPFNNPVTLTINGAIQDAADGSPLTLNFGPGTTDGGNYATLYLTGTNTFTGPINYQSLGGTPNKTNSALNITGSGQLGAGNYSNTISLGTSPWVIFNYGSSANQILSGTISGAGYLLKTGSGSLNLSAANTYTGPTTIANGTLLVNGSLAAGSAVTVNSSGTLGGTGTVYGAVTVNSGGTNAPGAATGASLGVLSCASNVTIAGKLSIDIDDTQTPTCDKLAVVGNLNITGATLNIVPAGSPTGLVYVIASYDSLAGSFAATNGLPSGYVVKLNHNGLNQIALTTIDVVNQPVTSCTSTSAVLGAQLYVPNVAADVFVYFGQTDGTNNPSAWTNSAYVGSWTNVASTNISFVTNNLILDTTYYFTFRATNGNSDVWASPSLSFRTLPTTLSSSVMGWDGGTTNIAENGDGASQGGNGNWNTTTNNWDQGAGVAHTFWNNAGNNTAIFGGTAGTVMLTNNITVGGLQFFTAGYMVRSNILTFGTAGNIAAYKDATIASAVSGTVAVAKTGGGTLTLSGSNYLTGLFSVQTGTVVATTNWVGENRSNQTVQVGGYGSPVLWTNTVGLTIGTGAVATNNTFNVVSQGVLRVNGAVTVGNSAGVNSMIVNSGTVVNVGALTIGYASGSTSASSNTMVLTNGASLFTGNISVGSQFSPGSGYVVNSNTLTFVNAFVQANGVLNIASNDNNNGTANYNQNWNRVIVNGGTLQGLTGINMQGAYVGRTVSYKYNSLIVTNGASVSCSGALNLDNGQTTGDANHVSNSVVVANGSFLSTVGGAIGTSGQMYDYMNVIGGGPTSMWNVGNGALTVGGNYTVLSIDGAGVAGSAVVTNGGALLLGATTRLTLTNGARLFTSGDSRLGNVATGTTTTVVGGSAPSIWNAGNRAIYAGYDAASYNQMLIGSGGVVTNVSTMGVGSASNSAAGITNNMLTVTDGGRLFTTANIFIGGGHGGAAGTLYSTGNSMFITNGGVVNAEGGIYVGPAGSWGTRTSVGDSLVIGSGGQLTSAGASYIGGNSFTQPSYATNDTVTIGGNLNGTNATWNMGGQTLFVGYTTAKSNAVIVNAGGVLTNAGLITVGCTNVAAFNNMTVSGGGVWSSSLVIGAGSSSNNTVTVTSNGVWNLGGASIINGIGSATGNVITVSSGGVLTNFNALVVSSGGASSNSVVLSAGGKIFAASASITNNNFMTVGVDDAATPACGYLAVSGTLNISNATLNIVTNAAPASPVYVIGSYGTLAGSFAATNGLPSGWVLNTNYAGLKQIALVQPLPLIPAVVNTGATNQGAGVCTLQGMVTSGGVVNAWICWGTGDAGTNSMTNWPSSAAMGAVIQSNVFSIVASGLSTNVTYWYRCFASNDYGTAWASPAVWFSAASGGGASSGGTITNYTLNGTNYYAHIFTNSGTFTATFGGNVEVLVVAGGGGSGKNGGGGGGAGGLLYTNAYAITNNQSITVTVGSGGAGAISSTNVASSGSNSVFGTMTAVGGGGGASRDGGGMALSGGSGGGGGGGASPQLTAGANTAGQGSNGGGGYNNGNYSAGGGGGGNASVGTSGAYQQGGNGGNGYWSSISGVYTGYCGGGAGSGLDYNSYGGKAGTVQTGAGGGGPQNNSCDARPYSGGGGGGLGTGLNSGDSGGGNGGSGIVIVRYVASSPIVNLAPTAVTNSSAVLNGQLICTATNYDVYVHWGTADGTNNAGSWAASAYVGSWTNVNSTNVCYTITGLSGSTNYYYTFRATNLSTNVWASPSWQVFTPVSDEDVNFTVLIIK